MRTVRYIVLPEACCGCGACARACPVGAVVVKPGGIADIDRTRCDVCGQCAAACKLRAIARKRGLWR